MNKVLVEIICPVTCKHYEFWISKKMIVKSVIKKIAEEIMQYEGNEIIFDFKEKIVLYFEREGAVLNEEYTMEQAGVESGSILMIV